MREKIGFPLKNRLDLDLLVRWLKKVFPKWWRKPMVESQTSPQTNPRTPCEEASGPPKTYTEKALSAGVWTTGKALEQ